MSQCGELRASNTKPLSGSISVIISEDSFPRLRIETRGDSARPKRSDEQVNPHARLWHRSGVTSHNRAADRRARPQTPWRTLEAGDRHRRTHCLSAALEAPLPLVAELANVPDQSRPGSVSIDFFTVPTAGLPVLFVLVVLAHDRRRVLHFNVTEHPTAAWTAQQIVDAFPDDSAPSYLLRDRDKIYGYSFRQREKGMGID